jgi:hypothetical protein
METTKQYSTTMSNNAHHTEHISGRAQCIYRYKSGAHQGIMCGNYCEIEEDYCRAHRDQLKREGIINQVKNDYKKQHDYTPCPVVIRSGLKQGQICGKINCSDPRHIITKNLQSEVLDYANTSARHPGVLKVLSFDGLKQLDEDFTVLREIDMGYHKIHGSRLDFSVIARLCGYAPIASNPTRWIFTKYLKRLENNERLAETLTQCSSLPTDIIGIISSF